MITKITTATKLLTGKFPLPAGAVPLASDAGELICLMPNGRWIGWLGGCIKNKHDKIQKEVVKMLIQELGGSAKSAAEKLSVGQRTVEGWSQGRPISIQAAYEIAQILN